jgi:uncharacterized protein (DUF302 family)
MAKNDLVTLQSAYDFDSTINRVLLTLEGKGISIFSRIDHAAGVAKVGLSLRPTTLIIFGNPAAGTPLMEAAQTSGIDLPLKALVWEDADGSVNLTYNDPYWIVSRHQLGNRVTHATGAERSSASIDGIT